jgi:hypothetical protein
MTEYCQFLYWKSVGEGEMVLEPVHPPAWLVAGVHERGEWPGLRPIEAVVESPVLRPDGTILDAPGYDPATGLLSEPNAEFPAVPDSPTAADLKAAKETLLALVKDFPFASKDHEAAWIAALLTPLARFAIRGPCPLFVFDANAPGTGKSLLTDVIAIVATGRGMARTAYAESDEEMRKRITAIALAGDRLMLLDNIATTLGGPALDAALTGTTWRDRILGRSEMTAVLPLITVWYASGNNVALGGDALRRVVPCRLVTAAEHPEERDDFTIKDLLEHATVNRPAILVAALTILRAHHRRGAVASGLRPFGSYESWSRVVRDAVHWAFGHDPCATRDGLREADGETNLRRALLEGWAELDRGSPARTPKGGEPGIGVARALDVLANELAEQRRTGVKSAHADLIAALLELSRQDHLPNARVVGKRLQALRGRVIGGQRFRSRTVRGIEQWYVEPVDDGGGRGGGGWVGYISRT